MYSQVTSFAQGYLDGYLWMLLIVVGIVAVVAIARRVLSYSRLLRDESVILELTPPSQGDKTPEATNQLFMSLYGLGSTRRFIDKLIGKRNVFSFEIVSSRTKGIRYLIRCGESMSQTVEHIVASYNPDVKVKRCDDYFEPRSSKGRVLEFRQKSHFAYPIQAHDNLSSHDPIGYITNAMTKLQNGEVMAFQVLIRPTKSREAESLNHKIMTNDDLLPRLHKGNFKPLTNVSQLLGSFFFGVADLFAEISHGSQKETYRAQSKENEYKKQVARRIKPVRTLSYFEHEMVESISGKLSQPLFLVDVRAYLCIKDKREYISRKKNIESALNLYAVSKYQKLSMRFAKQYLLQKYSGFAFQHRMPAIFATHSNTFAVSELASLYHFPHSLTARTENVIRSLSKTLPAPVSLKSGKKLGVLLGENHHQGTVTPIGLTDAERERHVYIIGGTGNGKTTMLQYQIIQDMRNGKGVAVIDPHGDMAETILQYVPEDRINDVVYFNPDDLEHPFALNLLELTPGLEGKDLLREKDIITESVISVFRKIFSDDDSGGHRIEYVLRNAIHTALTVENPTIFTVLKLLQNATYRRDITNKLTDEDLKDFWKNELGKAGDMQKVKMSAGITAKIGRFNVNASTKAILGEHKSTINFEDIMDSEKIFICNLSKGLLGEDVSELFGITVLAKLQLASLRRARVKQTLRKPYYLYVDEFQNFATPSFIQMLSEARKYKLFLTMAEQSTSQQDDQQLVSVILANVGTVICFRTGNPNDERLLLPLFSPYVEQGEIANLSAFNFYARLSSVIAQEPLSGVTLLLDSNGSDAIADRVIERSRKQYTQVAKPAEEMRQSSIQDKKKTRKSTKRASRPEAISKPAVKILGHQETS